jgi:hypothetical protein
LTKLGERGYNLVGDVCAEVDRKSELSIGDSDEISKFLTTFELLSARLLRSDNKRTLFSLSHFSSRLFFPC